MAAALLFLAICLAACSHQTDTASAPGPRILKLDPLDADSPSSELIAVTLQQLDETTLLTVDFLDLRIDDPPYLILEIDPWLGDTSPGLPSRYEKLRLKLTPTAIEALGTGSATDSMEGSIRADWDFTLDQVRILLPVDPSASPLPWSVKISAYDQGSSIASDSLGPVLTDAHEIRRAKLLLVFWNAFRGETPALALRSWNGAHSGPAGERFGLVYLLDAASRHSIPINLLGINSPSSLSGLDFLGKLDRIDELLRAGLISLPTALPEDYSLGSQPAAITQRLIRDRQEIATAYGISKTDWLALDSPSLSAGDLQQTAELGYRGLIVPIYNAAPGELTVWSAQERGVLVVAMPRTDTDLSIGEDGGLSIAWRRALIEAALSPGNQDLVVLGGSLPKTFWGDPQRVQNAFAWIAAHPWIDTLKLDELTRASLPVLQRPQDAGAPSDVPEANLASALLLDGSGQRNYLDQMALNLYARATSRRVCIDESDPRWDDAWAACAREPVEDLNQLRRLALADAWLLNYAAEWGRETACQSGQETGRSEWADLDHDGQIEAILWNKTYLAVFDPLGGRLSALFTCLPGHEVTSIIAPQATRVIGLSYPSLWDFKQGGIVEWADPLLAGAYVFSDAVDQVYELQLIGSRVQIVHPQDDFRILFSLSGNAIQAEFIAPAGIQYQLELGLLVAPERQDQPGFGSAYDLRQQAGSVQVFVDNQSTLEFSIPGAMWEVISGFDSPAPALDAEDPNLEMPPGHFVPLPFIVLKTTVQDGDRLSISFDPGSAR
jgi:hypothetical protein